MNKWTVQYILRNGHAIEGVWLGEENESHKVASALMDDSKYNFTRCYGKNNDSELFVRKSDIVAIEIFEYEEEEEKDNG